MTWARGFKWRHLIGQIYTHIPPLTNKMTAHKICHQGVFQVKVNLILGKQVCVSLLCGLVVV